MRIKEITLTNWMRFKGTHTLKLDAKAYAVVARRNDNEDTSNWQGKTSFLESIDFALWGRHQFRMEDDWINHSEQIGEVKLTLDDGTFISRRRERGKRTALHYESALVPKGAKQDEAQRLIAGMVGLEEEDFLATCYFKQRKMARLILAKPEERMDIVSGWLRLGPLERCEEKARSEVTAISERVQKLQAEAQSLQLLRDRILDGYTLEELDGQVRGYGDIVKRRREEYSALMNHEIENRKRVHAKAVVEDFDALVRDGKSLREELELLDGAKLKEAHERAREEDQRLSTLATNARIKLGEKRAVSKGEFDGTCPVAGIDCPAKADINRDQKRGLKLYQDAAEESIKYGSDSALAKSVEYNARLAVQEYERKRSKLELMREQVAKLEDAYEEACNTPPPIVDVHELRTKIANAERELNEAVSREATLKINIEQVAKLDIQMKIAEGELSTLNARMAVFREACVVFGKQGAQRRVAEGGLGEIEEGANGMLRDANLDLSIAVQWSREGTGLAKACDACGNPFPSSAKVKTCPRCSAVRGPQLINKLEFALSDRSGAAEDLSGIALQLSAAAWLRNERGSLWETALLDEPFSQCDKTNRMALGKHLAALLGGRYGFCQSFTVSHDRQTTESLPGRIEIVGSDEGSTIRVVS